MSMAGSFKADGAGHITAGEIDVNDGGTISTNSSLSGSYSFDSGGNGTLGTIQLTTTVGSVAHPIQFGFALNSAGNFGSIMDLSANNFIVAGTMQLQNSSAFTLASLAGDYAIIMSGRNQSQPTSALGRFTLASNGATTNVSFDRSIAGSTLGTVGPTTGGSAVVTFANTAPDANGRGTFTIALADGMPGAGTQNFAYYAITTNRFVAVETDGGGSMTADASRQSTPFVSTSDNTTGAVFGMAGFDTGLSAEVAAVGQLQISGAAGTLGWDSNDNGTLVSIASLAGQTVTFNSATGRGTVAVTGGVANGLSASIVFYLTAPGTGFVLDATSGATNRAMSGTLTAQTTVSTVAAADFPNLAILRSRGSAVTDAQSFIGEFGATTTTGVYAILSDQRFPSSGTTIQTGLDSGISPITVGTISAIGRGTLLNGNETLTFYVIGPNQFVLIDTSSGVMSSSSLFFATPN
jgi:hypothetical protein